MSSTYSSGKNVAAFTRENGEVVYALFEKTAESNVYPITARWGCIAVGSYDQVMLNVFQRATACEGGSLKGSCGRALKPENYIAAWVSEFSNSVRLDDFTINLEVGNWSAPIDARKLEDAILALQAIGRNDVIDAVRNGCAKIELYRDVDVVLALFGVGKLFSPWRILSHAEWRTVAYQELAPKPVSDGFQLPKLQVMVNRAGRGEILVQFDGGEWRQWGADYTALGEYMLNVVYPCEMKQSGCQKQLIAEFRNRCAIAQEIPMHTAIKLIQNTDRDSLWHKDVYERLVAKLGGPAGSAEFETTLAEILAVENGEWELGWLHPEQVIWNIQATRSQLTPVAQMDLLAA